MKTTIGIMTAQAQGRLFNPVIVNMASEFFGVLSKDDKDNQILWLTFPSKQNAKDFAEIIHLDCIDKNKETFK